MSRLAIVVGAIVGVAVLSGCAQEEGGPAFFRKVHTKPLPDSTVTIDGEEYVVKRATALEGRKKGEEVWAIVYKGKTYSCGTPSVIGCSFALTRAKKSETQRDSDMGY